MLVWTCLPRAVSGTATLDYYNGPELKGVTSITNISGGGTYGGYATMIVTGRGVGYGGGGGAGLGFYAGSSLVYCSGHFSWKEIYDHTHAFLPVF